MHRYIALLRAINVGGHTVKMDHLRDLFASYGCRNVATFIASGNVIFDSAATDAAALERSIERQLKQSLGYDVATFLRTPAELAAVADYARTSADERAAAGHNLYVAFLQRRVDAEAHRKLLAFCSDVDELQSRDREVYWLCRLKQSESGFSAALLEKTLATPATLRNITTVDRLVNKYCGDVRKL